MCCTTGTMLFRPVISVCDWIKKVSGMHVILILKWPSIQCLHLYRNLGDLSNNHKTTGTQERDHLFFLKANGGLE